MVREINTFIRERTVNGEPGKVPGYTVSVWMEILLKLTKNY